MQRTLLGDASGKQSRERIARSADGEARIPPGDFFLRPRTEDSVAWPLEDDRGAGFFGDFREFFFREAHTLKLTAVRREDCGFSTECSECPGLKGGGIEDEWTTCGSNDEFEDRERPRIAPDPGTDDRGVHRGEEFENGFDVILRDFFPDERMYLKVERCLLGGFFVTLRETHVHEIHPAFFCGAGTEERGAVLMAGAADDRDFAVFSLV